MRQPSRHLGTLLACLWLLQGVGCGYVVGGLHQNDVRTVAVPIFKSDSHRRGIEYQLTEAVQSEIKNRTHYRITTEDQAQTRLRGRIVDIRKRSLGETRYDDPRELEYSLAVEVVWEDLRTGAILAEQTIPLQPTSLHLDATAPFAPEVGQSQASANDSAMKKLAAQIVDRMESPW